MSTRQKRYRGHATIKSRVLAMVAAGTIKDYEVGELAALFDCSPRTIRNYVAACTRTPLADVTPADLPVELYDRKRMLIMIEWDGYRDCAECVCEELCRFLLERDCYVACERPLKREMRG